MIDHFLHIVDGRIDISTKILFARGGSFAPRALANKVASKSNCATLDEKYGRRWESIIEMKIQKASSSGD